MKVFTYILSASIILLLALSPLNLVAEDIECERIEVCYINCLQETVPQGKVLTVVFGVFCSEYEVCGEPLVLEPRSGQTQPTANFEVRGSPTLYFYDHPIMPTGNPGEYTADLMLPLDATVGEITVFIIQNSLYDGSRTGPELDTSHVETPDPLDDSRSTIKEAASTVTEVAETEPTTATTPTVATPAATTFDLIPGGVATIIAIIALIAILILLILYAAYRRSARARPARARKKK